MKDSHHQELKKRDQEAQRLQKQIEEMKREKAERANQPAPVPIQMQDSLNDRADATRGARATMMATMTAEEKGEERRRKQ